MKMRIFAFVAMTILIGSEADAQKVHVILVGDTRINDQWQNPIINNDLRLGFETNMSIMRSLLDDAKSLGAFDPIYYDRAQADNFNCATISAEVRRAKSNLTLNDTVVFYYSGHGYMNQNSNVIKFPEFYCSSKTSSERSDLASVVKVLAEQIKGNGPRLVLALADTCNSDKRPVTPSQFPSSVLPLGPPVEKARVKQAALQKLFLNYRGVLTMNGCSQGEKCAYWTSDVGAFTYTLQRTIEDNFIKGAAIRWEEILDKATEKNKIVTGFRNFEDRKQIYQNPYYEAPDLKPIDPQ